MNTERWEQVRAIFESVCDLAPDQRDSTLAALADGDVELREEVRALLSSSDEAPAFLDPAADGLAGLLAADPACTAVGRTIAGWSLERHIASGGMGAVYLGRRSGAKDGPAVAVKLLRRRLVRSETLRRFHTERQALARLDHRNIARLLESGVSDEGLPYLVMEYVDGLPIGRYCDQHELSTARRLELFREVCAAVQYAHRNLIVHRDLKPANILVTAAGTPKLLDFGTARLLDPARGNPRTGPGHLMTVEYASPEQIQGEPLTTASDVYSLGVVLYEMLTGRRPHRDQEHHPHALERAICDVDPERPSAVVARPEGPSSERLRRRLAGDLDAIVLKALRKEPERRYVSVEQLAQDLGRHLEGLPVLARRGTVRYRAGKFLRRHRTMVVVAAALLLSLVAGIAGTTWQGLVARRAEEAATAEAIKLGRAFEFLRDMLASVDPNLPGDSSQTVRRILDQATREIDGGAFGGDAQVEADVRLTVGRAYLEHGALDQAEAHLNAARDLRLARLGPGHPAVAEAINALGRVAKSRGRHDEAERLYRAALDIRRRFLDEESPEVAESLNDLGVLLKTTDDLDSAEGLLDRAVAIRRAAVTRLEGHAAADPALLKRGRIDLATSLSNLAAVLKNQGRYEDVEHLYDEALKMLRQALGERHYRVAVVLNNRALLLMELERYDQAEALFHAALDIRREVFGPEHLSVATGLKNLALLLATAGRTEEAEPLYRQALDLGRRLPGNDDLLANTLNNYADVMATLGRYDEAEALCREALETRRARDADHPRLAGSSLVMGRIFMGRGEPQQAEAWLREALAAYESQGAGAERHRARARSELASCLVALGRHEEAHALLNEESDQ